MSENLSIDIVSDEESTVSFENSYSARKEKLTLLERPTEESNREFEISVSCSKCPDKDDFNRLVVVSWKIRQYGLLVKALKDNVAILRYQQNSTFSSILDDIKNLLHGNKIVSLAFLCHGNPGCISICQNKVLSLQNFKEDVEIKQFFCDLVDVVIDRENPNSHLDLLSSSLDSPDGLNVVQALQDYIRLPITTNKDIFGPDSKKATTGEIYFSPAKLRSWSGFGGQSISNYEKIRTLGRGAYGTAVLYRKKDDDSLVVLKEISILELNATERSSAMNEVKVLSMLSHPNIVSYYDSFEEDGTLWIEMEYADGGTLGDFLGKQENDLEEQDILIMFSQMVSAIKYCHDRNILHRDLKTQNIFLTQEGRVKLGDFGIAKIMTTRAPGNFTVVGTPYYISPEMCEGLSYDNKSDIWALGCILYEMANLAKTFDGTNLPALINKIVKGTYAPIKETYRPEFRMLIYDLLQKNPATRPTAEEILFTRLAELLKEFDDISESSVEQTLTNCAKTRSILYYCDVTTMQLHLVQDLPVKMQITEVAVGLAHIVCLSNERGIYTWGDNTYGQLGLGDTESRDKPTEVEHLRGKCIVSVICGNFFTGFLTDNGLILTCGQGDFGCLGHGDWSTITRPKLIDKLLTLDINSLVSGCNHVAVTTTEGDAFTWGCGNDGRLGHGNEENLCLPTIVSFGDEKVFVQDVHCSDDGTVFIADTRNLFACGNNQGNKLGLNPRQGFLYQFRSKSNKNVVEKMMYPLLVKDCCKYQISSVMFGRSHSTLINVNGRVYTNGDNSYGQLGCGNTKPREVMGIIKGFEDTHFSNIACGTSFSFAGMHTPLNQHTVNTIYFWGMKPSKQGARSRTISIETALSSIRPRKASAINDDDADVVCSRDECEQGCNSLRSRGIENTAKCEASQATLLADGWGSFEECRSTYLKNMLKGSNTQTLNLAPKQHYAATMPYVVFQIESIGGIPGYEDEEFALILRDIVCSHDHVLIHFETNAPSPKTCLTKVKSFDSTLSSHSGTFKEEVVLEMDTIGEAPTWIRDELEDGIPLAGQIDCNVKESETEVAKEIVYKELEESSVEEEEEVQQIFRSFPFQTLRKGTHNFSKDPNFNLIPKLQRQGTLQNAQPSSSTPTRKPLISANSLAAVEYIPNIPNSVETSPQFSTKAKRKIKIKNPANNRYKIKSPSTKDSAANSKKDDGRAEKDERQRQLSEEKLNEEINRLKFEKEKRETELEEIHQRQLKEKDEASHHQEQEANKREQHLKEEIHSLKSELNHQNSKLKDNYSILLSLQEQLLRMQQNQIRTVPQNTLPPSVEPPAYSEKPHPKSSVCSLM